MRTARRTSSDPGSFSSYPGGSRDSSRRGAESIPKLSFVKDIVPIFTKSGCANSNCHGSIRGQAGFKLSLFGYEPDLDYQAIVKAQDGRRINRKNPAKSLILLKPTFASRTAAASDSRSGRSNMKRS